MKRLNNRVAEVTLIFQKEEGQNGHQQHPTHIGRDFGRVPADTLGGFRNLSAMRCQELLYVDLCAMAPATLLAHLDCNLACADLFEQRRQVMAKRLRLSCNSWADERRQRCHQDQQGYISAADGAQARPPQPRLNPNYCRLKNVGEHNRENYGQQRTPRCIGQQQR